MVPAVGDFYHIQYSCRCVRISTFGHCLCVYTLSVQQIEDEYVGGTVSSKYASVCTCSQSPVPL